jgi:hypothetical protein
MCVHADSGGAAAAAYSLTWYGEGADVDKVLLENGPVFSDINRGCEVTWTRIALQCTAERCGRNR